MRIKSVQPENRPIKNEPSFGIKRNVSCLIPVTWSVRERISRRYISSFYYIDVKCFHTTADYNDFDAPTQPTPLLIHLRFFFGDFSGPPILPSRPSRLHLSIPIHRPIRPVFGCSSTAINIRAGRISLERVRFRRPLAASCPLLVRSRALFFFVVLLFSGGSASHRSLFS